MTEKIGSASESQTPTNGKSAQRETELNTDSGSEDAENLPGLPEDGKSKSKGGELHEERVRQLAQQEIQRWQAETQKTASMWYRPRSWRTETQAGAVLVAVILMVGGLYEHLTPERAILVDHLHYLIDTDRRVIDRLKSELNTEDFGNQLITRIRDAVPERSGADNPLFGLVKRAMHAAPILAFHGEASFGQPLVVTVTNKACRAFVQAELTATDGRSAPTVETIGGVEELCDLQVLLDVASPLDIPFHARFFELPEVGEPHNVWLVLYIQRFDIETDARLPDERTASNLPVGLCILYNSASEDLRTRHRMQAGLAITNMRGAGNGFWIANLTENLRDAGFDLKAPDLVNETELLHSVLIEAVQEGNRPDGAPCAEIVPVDGQVISVRAMVLVNKTADDRIR